jgi:hypothetical protein
MDDNGSAWSHDPAARLGPASDVPDGLERLGPGPAPQATPATNGGAVAVRPPGGDTHSVRTTTPSESDREADADDDAVDDDPPPRWAGGRAPAPHTTDDAPDEATAAAAQARRHERAAGSRSPYWAAAILIVFATIAGVGLTRRGDGDDPASTGDRSPSSATTAAGARTGASSTTVPETATTPGPAAAGDVTRAPEVGECAAAVEGTPWQYVYRPCEDGRATVRLTQTLTSPPPAGTRCPDGTDTVAQVTQDAGSAGGAGALWCLRNLSAPHPGEPGAGGGQLMVGDCLGTASNGSSVEVPCEGGDPSPDYRVGWMPDAAGACPTESVAAIDLQVPFPARFCLEYV